MRRLQPLFAALALAAALPLAGCPSEDGGPGDEGAGEDTADATYGYVPLLTGKVAKLDADTLEVVDKLGSGHSVVHGVAVVDGTPWLGNRDDSSVEIVGAERSIDIGRPINRVVAGPGTGIVAVSGDAIEFPFGAHVTFLDATDGAVLGVAEIPLDDAMMGPTSRPVDDNAEPPRQECSTCPRTGVAIHGDDAWVVHTRNHALYKFNAHTAALVERFDIPKPEGVDLPALSPFLSVSPYGRVATPDLYARRVSLFNPPGELSTGDHLAVEAEWSPDGATLYVLTAESEVRIGDEKYNADIATEILAVDAATLEVKARGTYDKSLNHITPRPDGVSLFATSASATVIRFDAVTLTQTGLVQVTAGVPPALDVYF